MHPTVYARRRAEAEARLSEGISALADRAGLQVTPTAAGVRDQRVGDLYRLEQLADVVEALNSPYVRPGPDEPEPPPPPGEQGSDVLAGTVEDVEAAVAGIDDVNELQRIYDEEQEGKDRKGALQAIEARIHELTDEDGE